MDEITRVRFVARVTVLPNGCWQWTGRPGKNGYAYVTIRRRRTLVHRLSHELHAGAIPSGYQVDHLCHNADPDCAGGITCAHRVCVRPDHLEAVTQQENLRRAGFWEARAAHQRSKTHCPQGHGYTADNTRIYRGNQRACRECDRSSSRKHAAAKRAASPPKSRRNDVCSNGHSYAEFGYWNGRQNVCRPCMAERVRQSRARRRAEAPPKPVATHCPRGHEWNEQNTYVPPSGKQRHCRACHRDDSREWHRERTAARRADAA